MLLVDISATGARLQSSDLPAAGDELYLRVGRLKAFCAIRWRTGDECGVQFYEKLAQIDVIAVRREVIAGGGMAPSLKAAEEDWILGIAR